jgi:hypothetical protein
MASLVGPRFLLPKISQRITHVRPTSLAALTPGPAPLRDIKTGRSISIATHQHHTSNPLSTCGRCIQPQIHQKIISDSSQHSALLFARRSFSSTTVRARDHHFDTLKFVQRLKDEGFTEEQAVAMMKVLSDVIEERHVDVKSQKSMPTNRR